jgi:hypothetical protein
MASPVANNIRKEAALKRINPALRQLASRLGVNLENELGRFSKDEGVNQAMQLEWLANVLENFDQALALVAEAANKAAEFEAKAIEFQTRITELERNWRHNRQRRQEVMDRVAALAYILEEFTTLATEAEVT